MLCVGGGGLVLWDGRGRRVGRGRRMGKKGVGRGRRVGKREVKGEGKRTMAR